MKFHLTILLWYVRTHLWALGEAWKTYRAALAYCADCDAQAEAHYAAEDAELATVAPGDTAI